MKIPLLDTPFYGKPLKWRDFARIGVDPDLRKRGYGKELMMHLFDRAREVACEYMTLEVRASNEAAFEFVSKKWALFKSMYLKVIIQMEKMPL